MKRTRLIAQHITGTIRSFSHTQTAAMPKEYKLKDVTSLQLGPGVKREVEVEGIEEGKVLLVNAGNGQVQAVGSKCTHYGAPLVKGVLTTTGRLTCPWHGACFNAKTGDVEDAPALDALPVFKTIERDGAVYIQGEESAIKASRRKPNFRCSAAPTGSEDKIVVVGGGSGAMGFIEELREGGYTGPLTVISKEGYLPIDRTKLSKALIDDTSKVQWRNKDWFDNGAVEWVDAEVNDIDFSARKVKTATGVEHSYTKLVLASGGTAKKLPMQGFKVLDNIFTLRSIHDTKKINAVIGEKKGKKIVIVGSSFIGMEAAAATAADNDVTVVGMEKVPLLPILGEQVGAGIQKIIEGKGVKFIMNASVDKAEPSPSDQSKVGAVFLSDGTKLEADLVILGVGVSPSTEYLQKNSIIRLEDDGSIQTDETFSVVGLKDVYAIGDIAKFPYHGPDGAGKPVRIEHWNVAQNAGRTVAKHIAKPSTPQKQFIPVFWSALGSQLRYTGHTPNGYDDVVVQGKPEEAKFAAYYTKGETVVAMASMGWDPAMSQTMELMRNGKMVSKSQLKDGLDIVETGPPE